MACSFYFENLWIEKLIETRALSARKEKQMIAHKELLLLDHEIYVEVQ